jgi:sugar lactone lactonase YvrE
MDGLSNMPISRIIGTVEGSADNQFSQPRGMCLCQRTQEIFVVDSNNHRIQVFDLRSLAFIRTIGEKTMPPLNFMAAGHGNLGVNSNERVLGTPMSCCLDDEGCLYVSDTTYHRIMVFNQYTGEALRTISSQGSLDGFINKPYGICIDQKQGHVYVADHHNHRIQVFNKDSGIFIKTIGYYGTTPGMSPGQFNEPISVAIDFDSTPNKLYVCDYLNNRVQIFNKDTGMHIGFVGVNMKMNRNSNNNGNSNSNSNSNGEVRGPRGIYVDHGSKLLIVTERENNYVKIYDKDTNTLVRYFSSDGESSLPFNRPMELCVNASEGTLLVVDAHNHRIVVMPIEELQDEKYRIQERIKAIKVAEERQRNKPKASRTAVEAMINEAIISSISASSGNTNSNVENRTSLELRFPKLGPLYRIKLESDDITNGNDNILLHMGRFPSPKVTEGQSQSQGQDMGKKEEYKDEEQDAVNNMMTMQAQAFVGAMSAVSTPPPSPTKGKTSGGTPLSVNNQKKLLVPSALALHSLLERHWKPPANSIPRDVISSLASVLSDLNNSAVNNEEQERVILAIGTIFRGVVQAGDAEFVYKCVLDSMSNLEEPLYEEKTIDIDDYKRTGIGLMNIPRDREIGMLNSSSDPDLTLASIIPGSPHLPTSGSSNKIFSSEHLNSTTGPLRLGQATFAHLQLICDILKEEQRSVESITTVETKEIETETETETEKGVGGELRMNDIEESSHSISNKNKNKNYNNNYNNNNSNTYVSAYHKDVVTLVFGATLSRCMDTTEVSSPVTKLNMNIPQSLSSSNPSTPSRFGSGTSLLSPSPSPSPSRNTSSRRQSGESWISPTTPGSMGRVSNQQEYFASFPKDLKPLLESVFHLQQCFNSSFNPHSNTISYNKEDEENLLVSVLNLAANHFQSTQKSLETTNSSDVTKSNRRKRGGANIWREGESMCVGDLVDAMDKEKCWFESIITEVRPGMNVKVHFMGWGSKWDDIIPIEELDTRCATLNSQTKDWRSDLFEGGLIEIKCNEDTVHQKWMWGKIIALNIQEEWVDVSYNFSNEPVILKRAKLFGENICPVGMHTKDRSKAVLATIKRPQQKVEELVRSKEESSDDLAFYDRDDELMWDLDADPTIEYGNDPSTEQYTYNSSSNKPQSKDSQNTNTDHLPTLVFDYSGPVDQISMIVFQQVMSAVLSAVTSGLTFNSTSTSFSSSVESCTMKMNISDKKIQQKIDEVATSPSFKAAENVLNVLAAGPFKRLLAPYFCRLLTFQCGIKAKILAECFLSKASDSFTSREDLLGSCSTLKHIKHLEMMYAQLAVRCLGNYLSVNLMQRVLHRLTATVKRCSFTKIASKFTLQLCNTKKSDLQNVLLTELLLNDTRYSGEPCALRGLLSQLLDACGVQDLRRIAEEWTNVLKEWVQIKCCQQSQLSNSKNDNEKSFTLLDDLHEMLKSARLACEQEFDDTAGTFRLTAEVAFRRAFTSLPTKYLHILSKDLAHRLALLLDTSSNISGGCASRAELIDRTLDLAYLGLAEEISTPFQQYYEQYLAARLLAGTYVMSDEIITLKKLPSMPNATLMLNDIETFDSYTLDFKKSMLSKLDRGEINYSSAMKLLFYNNNSVKIRSISSSLWPKNCTHISLYHNLNLPYSMKQIANEFDMFCGSLPTVWPLSAVQSFTDANNNNNNKNNNKNNNNNNDPISGLCKYQLNLNYGSFISGKNLENANFRRKKKYFWCHGSGKVDVALLYNNRKRLNIEVSEPLAAVLMTFNQPLAEKKNQNHILTLSEVSHNINLSENITLQLLRMLCDHSVPILEECKSDDNDNDDDCVLGYRVNPELIVSRKEKKKSASKVHTRATRISLNSGNRKYTHALTVLKNREQKWQNNTLDAAILRCLKSHMVKSSEPISIEMLSSNLRDAISKTPQDIMPLNLSTIISRCDALIETGLIEKHLITNNTITKNNQSDAYAYGANGNGIYSHTAQSGVGYTYADIPTSVKSGHTLFERLIKTIGINPNPIISKSNSSNKISNQEPCINMKQFTQSYMDWIGNITLANLTVSVNLSNSIYNDDDDDNDDGDDDDDGKGNSNEKRWSDPLKSADIRSIVSALMQATGVAATQLARLEMQVRPQQQKDSIKLCLEHSLSSYVNTIEQAVITKGKQWSDIVEKVDIYRLCFESIRPVYVLAAMQMLYSCSLEPCPAPESLKDLTTAALLARVPTQWHRKHAVSTTSLKNAGASYGCSELVEALTYLGSDSSSVMLNSSDIVTCGSGNSGSSGNTGNSGNRTTTDEIEREEEKGVAPAIPHTYNDRSGASSSAGVTLRISLRDIFFAVMRYDEPASCAAIVADSKSKSKQNVFNTNVNPNNNTNTNTNINHNSSIRTASHGDIRERDRDRDRDDYMHRESDAHTNAHPWMRGTQPPRPSFPASLQMLSHGSLMGMPQLPLPPPTPPDRLMNAMTEFNNFTGGYFNSMQHSSQSSSSSSASAASDFSSSPASSISNNEINGNGVDHTEDVLSLHDRLLLYLNQCDKRFVKSFPNANANIININIDKRTQNFQNEGKHHNDGNNVNDNDNDDVDGELNSSGFDSSGILYAAASVPTLSILLIDNTAAILSNMAQRNDNGLDENSGSGIGSGCGNGNVMEEKSTNVLDYHAGVAASMGIGIGRVINNTSRIRNGNGNGNVSSTGAENGALLALQPSVTLMTETFFSYLDKEHNGTFGPSDMQSTPKIIYPENSNNKDKDKCSLKLDEMLMELFDSDSSSAVSVSDGVSDNDSDSYNASKKKCIEILKIVKDVLPAGLTNHDLLQLLCESNWDLGATVDRYFTNPNIFIKKGVNRYAFNTSSSASTSADAIAIASASARDSIDNNNNNKNVNSSSTSLSKFSSLFVNSTQGRRDSNSNNDTRNSNSNSKSEGDSIIKTCKTCGGSSECNHLLAISCGHVHCNSCWLRNLKSTLLASTKQLEKLRCPCCQFDASPHFIYTLCVISASKSTEKEVSKIEIEPDVELDSANVLLTEKQLHLIQSTFRDLISSSTSFDTTTLASMDDNYDSDNDSDSDCNINTLDTVSSSLSIAYTHDMPCVASEGESFIDLRLRDDLQHLLQYGTNINENCKKLKDPLYIRMKNNKNKGAGAGAGNGVDKDKNTEEDTEVDRVGTNTNKLDIDILHRGYPLLWSLVMQLDERLVNLRRFVTSPKASQVIPLRDNKDVMVLALSIRLRAKKIEALYSLLSDSTIQLTELSSSQLSQLSQSSSPSKYNKQQQKQKIKNDEFQTQTQIQNQNQYKYRSLGLNEPFGFNPLAIFSSSPLPSTPA